MITTFAELQKAVREIMPNADIQSDLQGQLVIYTGLTTKYLQDIGSSEEESDIIEFK